MITSVGKNDDLQCSFVAANKIDEHRNAGLLSLDVTVGSRGTSQTRLTIEIDVVHSLLTALFDQPLNHKRTKTAPTPNTQKCRILLKQPHNHLPLRKQADNHSAVDAEFVLKNSLVLGLDAIEPISENIRESVNRIRPTELTSSKYLDQNKYKVK